MEKKQKQRDGILYFVDDSCCGWCMLCMLRDRSMCVLEKA